MGSFLSYYYAVYKEYVLTLQSFFTKGVNEKKDTEDTSV